MSQRTEKREDPTFGLIFCHHNLKRKTEQHRREVLSSAHRLRQRFWLGVESRPRTQGPVFSRGEEMRDTL